MAIIANHEFQSKTFDTIEEACAFFGCSEEKLKEAINKNTPLGKGVRWFYVDELAQPTVVEVEESTEPDSPDHQ